MAFFEDDKNKKEIEIEKLVLNLTLIEKRISLAAITESYLAELNEQCFEYNL